MGNINLGVIIDNIYLFIDKEVDDQNFVFKKIIVKTEKEFVIFKPDNNTDEILVMTKKSIEDISKEDKVYSLSEFNGRKLVSVWYCKNDQGYLDQVVLGVDLLRPSLSLLCECGLIGLFKNEAINLSEVI